MVEEARQKDIGFGQAPVSDGWFVTNVADGAWLKHETFGRALVFETPGGEPVYFPDVGVKLVVLSPGQPNGLYHHETNQEDFLILSGECLLLIEGEERRLRAGDFVHCPPETAHIFVGAGDGRCAIFMLGGRTRPEVLVYPRSEVALRHGAGVETETRDPDEAYGPFDEWKPDPEAFDQPPWH